MTIRRNRYTCIRGNIIPEGIQTGPGENAECTVDTELDLEAEGLELEP